MTHTHFVIIGSGPAGIFAAEAIRARDEQSPITMVTADAGPATSPVMLTYWMRGEMPRKVLFFRDPCWAEKMKVETRLSTRVRSLAPPAKELKLEGGGVISYDRLLIATGGKPISLLIPGMGSKGVSAFRTERDGVEIVSDGLGVKEVIIIGGGFIGLKLACYLKERGLAVTILEKEPKLAARIFDLRTSKIVQRRMRWNGIRVETDVGITEVLNENGSATGVRLSDGRVFPCQRLIQSVGVRPNTEFLRGSGIEVEGGILVNDRMETNVPDIYAAGDVAVTTDSISSERLNNATWSAATRQGSIAGGNMAGGNRRYIHNFPMNAIDLYGHLLMSAGHSYLTEGSGIRVLVKEEADSYRKLVMRDGKLIGFILVGDVSGVGFLLNLMKSKDLPNMDAMDLLNGFVSMRDLFPSSFGYRHGLLFRE